MSKAKFGALIIGYAIMFGSVMIGNALLAIAKAGSMEVNFILKDFWPLGIIILYIVLEFIGMGFSEQQ